jgi:hypothetical protein
VATKRVFGPSWSLACGRWPFPVHPLRILSLFLSISAVVSHVPYFVGFLTTAMGRSGSLQRANAFGRGSVLKRLGVGANRRDLFYYLVRPHIESDMLISLKPVTEWRGASRSRASLLRRHCAKRDVSNHCRFGYNKQHPHGRYLLPVTQSGSI